MLRLALSTLVFLLVAMLLGTCQSPPKTVLVPANDPLLHYIGRIDRTHASYVRFSYTGVTIKARFKGDFCRVRLRNESPKAEVVNYYQVEVEGQSSKVYRVGPGDAYFDIDLPKAPEHVLTIFKRTESQVGTAVFEGLELAQGQALLPLPKAKRTLEFIGNSITCGYGNEGTEPSCPFSPETENGYMAYGALTARALDADYVAVAYSGKGVVQNYDLLDKETMPVLYDRVIPSDPKVLWKNSPVQPDAVVINLGTNDFAHAAPDSAAFVGTYVAYVQKLRKNYPNTTFFCIEGCMTKDGWPKGVAAFTLVKRYIDAAAAYLRSRGDTRIHTYYPETAHQGDFGCDWHPNLQRHQKMAEELTSFIKEKMQW